MVNAKDLENEVKNSQNVSAEDAVSDTDTGETKEAESVAEESVTEEAVTEDISGEEPAKASTEEEAETSGETEEAAETTEKKGFFKKKEKKDKKDEKIEELNDRLMRQMAEFDNFRKRSEREKSMMFDMGAKDVVEKILPVVDNFERGLGSLSEEAKQEPFAQGMEKVYRQLMTALETMGVKPIEAVGCEFNPDFHNAVMHIEDEAFGENVVAEEFQKGYLYKESVVRHSMVKVAN